MKKIKFKIILLLLLILLIIMGKNTVLAKYIFETNEILIVETYLDRTPPKLDISYSTKDITNGDVLVTIKCNEKIKNIDGWSISEDKQTLTKIYETNKTEEIEVSDLAGNKTKAKIEINNIDKVAPQIVCTEIKNTNMNYTGYANSEKEIDLTIKISDNIEINNINLNKINIKVGNSNANLTKEWTLKTNSQKEKIYNLKLKNIKGDGILTLLFEEGFVIDTANNNNIKTNINTKIMIDNTKPNVTYSQQIIEQGKVNSILTANEKVQKLNGWNLSSDSLRLNKEFVSNVSYELTVTDLAGNKTIVTVNVTGATYISLIYASHNSNVGWTYGYGNYDIAGREAIKENPIYKTEALAFNVNGNISKDFVKGRAYVYSYWGEGSKALCTGSKMAYSYGYNPSPADWKTMNSGDLVTIEGKKYFQFRRRRNKW